MPFSRTHPAFFILSTLKHQFNYNSKITFTVCQLNTIQIARSCITNKQTNNKFIQSVTRFVSHSFTKQTMKNDDLNFKISKKKFNRFLLRTVQQ